VLTTPQCFCDGLWAAWSWHRFLHDSFELELVVDGEISRSDENAAQRLFPGVRIFRAETIISALCKSHPGFVPFFDHHPLGKKLGVILAFQDERPLLYSDHDVMAFNFPSEIMEQADKGIPLYITEEKGGVFDSEIIQRAQMLKVEYAPELNSGLMYVPQGSLSINLASTLLADWRPPMCSWFTEQAISSVLLQQAGGISLPREKYVVSNRRQFYWEQDVDYSRIVARHFTGPVRHVMYGKGMRFIGSHLRNYIAPR
jgi:hypothetical protein